MRNKYDYWQTSRINTYLQTFQKGNDQARWNYMCLGIEPLFDLSIFIAVDKVKGQLLYNKVWKDNRTQLH
jgi:hypothetical protein